MRGILRIGVLATLLLPAFIGAQWEPNQQGINFRSYKRGIYSGLDKPLLEVLNSQGDLERIWPKLTGEDPSQAPKDVKWGEERLILVSLGERKTSGYSTFVKSIERKNSNLVVNYIEKTPPPGMAVLMVITSPWELVRTARVSGNISFEKKIDRGITGITVIDTGHSSCNCNCGCKCCGGG
jgi:hypothetical protein